MSRGPNKSSRIAWWCKCDCGNEKLIVGGDLKNGRVNSCKCLQRELAIQRYTAPHGKVGSRVYGIWSGMIQRCTNPARGCYKHYGAKGITVCERWRTFENFLADMGEPAAGLTLDRINSDGNYEPGNCRWATAKEQARNRAFCRASEEMAAKIREGRAAGTQLKELASTFGVSLSVVRNIVYGRSWA